MVRRALGIGFVVGVTTLSYFSIPAAIIAICASVLVALHGKASTLVELSFGPLKAKLQRDLSEAEQLVGKLRSLAVLQAKATIAASVRTGRFADSSDWQFTQLGTTEAALRDLGVAEADIIGARAEFLKFVVSDLGRTAMGSDRIPLHLGKDVEADWRAVTSKGLEKTPDDVEAFLRKWGQLTPARVLRIEDMRWIIENSDLRDREQYMRSKQPVAWH